MEEAIEVSINREDIPFNSFSISCDSPPKPLMMLICRRVMHARQLSAFHAVEQSGYPCWRTFYMHAQFHILLFKYFI